MARFRRELISEGGLDLELEALNRERAGVRAQLSTAESARGAAMTGAERVRAAGEALEGLRAAMAVANPQDRWDLVRTLVDPGEVTFDGDRVRITLFVPRAAEATSRGVELGAVLALAKRSDWRTHAEAKLRIRLVA